MLIIVNTDPLNAENSVGASHVISQLSLDLYPCAQVQASSLFQFRAPRPVNSPKGTIGKQSRKPAPRDDDKMIRQNVAKVVCSLLMASDSCAHVVIWNDAYLSTELMRLLSEVSSPVLAFQLSVSENAEMWGEYSDSWSINSHDYPAISRAIIQRAENVLANIAEFPRIEFSSEFIPRILSGKKTATTRIISLDPCLKSRTSQVKAGDVLAAFSSSPDTHRKAPFAVIQVSKVQHLKNSKELLQLKTIVEREGFESSEELLQALRKFYGQALNSNSLTLIEFCVLHVA